MEKARLTTKETDLMSILLSQEYEMEVVNE
jgi:hypothetical protein